MSFILEKDFFEKEGRGILNLYYTLNESLFVMFLDRKMTTIEIKEVEFFPIYTNDVPERTEFILMNGRRDLLEKGDGVLVSFSNEEKEITISICGRINDCSFFFLQFLVHRTEMRRAAGDFEAGDC